MRRFRFALEPVLQQRKWIEEQRALAYAQAQREESRQRERLQDLENRVRRYADALEERKRGTLTVSEVRVYLHYLDRLQEERQQQVAAVEQAHQICEEARAQWQQANRDLKALEALKEHAYARHLAQGRKEEQKLLDEVGSRLESMTQSMEGNLGG